ncbi:uncharacterized protein LOC128550959 [Mercenaria mercenaria]|uniref:uncharacterized protein LOC128550959 n=1 Tax=Mercenaria mercenaria TaxID=6596 RepID=UPI00234E724A|nr:uncharacterized protein LOC128550959 [Mercenaria mercenaria]
MKAFHVFVLINLLHAAEGKIPIPHGCSVFNIALNGFHGFPLPTIHSLYPLYTKGSPLIGKRFIINSPIHLNYSGLFPLGGLNIDMSKLFNVSTQLVLDSIKPTLPASKEISHTCRIGLKTTSQNEIDFVKAMMKIYKVCAVCDKFDTNTTTCETVGFCPKNSVCYQGYTDDRKYWPKSNVYNIFDAMHPRAGFHGCCLPTDSRCRYHRYIVKNKNNHNLKSANYTIHTCSSSIACNGNDRHAVSSFVSKLSKYVST